MKPKKRKGVTIIEILIAVFVISLVALAVYSMYSFSLKVLAENKAKTGGISLANQWLEMARNLPYNDVGVEGGIPAGVLPQTQTQDLNGLAYTINIRVKYLDDPFDGQGGDDPLPYDYKMARIEVSWPSSFGGNQISYSTHIAPQGIETLDVGGTLWVQVFDANGDPVSGAEVHIVNNEVDPVVDFPDYTDVHGSVYLPGAQPSVNSYELTVTKAGYSVDQTCPIEAGTPNPICPVSIENTTPFLQHVTVLDGEITPVSFAIDKVSQVTINTLTYTFADQWIINNDLGIEEQNTPVVALDSSNNLIFTFKDYRDTSSPRIYSQKYNLAGQKQWLTDLRITDSVNSVEPDIAVDENDNIYYAWADDSLGNRDSYLVKFDSAGNDLWGGAKKINTDAASADQTTPKIIYDETNQNIYISWKDERNGNDDIYLQSVDIDGNLIWPSEIQVNSDTISATQINQDMAMDSTGNLYIVWADNRDMGAVNIYMQKFDSDGNKLYVTDKKVNIDTSLSIRVEPVIAIDSVDNVFVAWTDDRNGDNDIYWQKLNTDATPQWAEDKKVDDDNSQLEQSSPSITIDENDNIFMAWTDARHGNSDIFSQKYDSDGVAQWEIQVRINTDSGTADQVYPDILAICPDQFCVVWADSRNGNYDIYAAVYGGPGAVTTVGSVDLDIHGSKLIGLDPEIYKYENDHSTDGSGILSLTSMEWDSYEISLDAASPYSIIYSTPNLPLNIEPDSSYQLYVYLE